MNEMIVIISLVSLIVLFLIIGAPVKSMKWFAQFGVKVFIGVLLLFFINVFGGSIGLHIPINFFTVAVSSILGLFGVISILLIHVLLL